MLSFWEKQSYLHYDIIIVGGGISGMSTALSILENSPNKSIAIFEASTLPSGASTKNAGFCTFGSLEELVADEIAMGTDAMLHLVENRWKGLQMLRQRLGDKNIDFQNNGGYEFLFDTSALSHMEEMNKKLFPIFKKDVFELANPSIKKMGFNTSVIKSMLYNSFEGQIDTGKMMKCLESLVLSKNIKIFSNSKVDKLIENGVLVNGIEFKSQETVICTNAFAKELIPEIQLEAGRGQVLISKPIKNMPFKGIFHYDEGYYYFRNFENRLLFGGGRNQDFETENTTEIGLNQKVQNHLKDEIKRLIFPNQTIEIEHQWAGIMAFGSQKTPIIKRIDDRTIIAVKMSGIGIALGSFVGSETAKIINYD